MKRFILLLALLAPQAWADMVQQAEFGPGLAVHTSVTVDAATDLGLIYTLAVQEGGGTVVMPTACTANGDAMAEAVKIVETNHQDVGVAIWYLPNPDVGTYTPACTGGTFTEFTTYAYVMTDFKQATPVAGFTSKEEFESSPFTITLASVNDVDGGFGVSVYALDAGATLMTWTNIDQDYSDVSQGGDHFSGASKLLTGTAGRILTCASDSGATSRGAACAYAVFDQEPVAVGTAQILSGKLLEGKFGGLIK